MNRQFGMRRCVCIVLSLLLAFGPAGGPVLHAQNLPDLGDESAGVLTPQMERRIGKSYYRELRRDPVYLEDAEVKAYCEERAGG